MNRGCWTTYDNDDHARSEFASDEKGTAEQNDDCHGDRNDGQVKLGIVLGGGHHDQELDGKAKEKEEIELQQSDVDLVGEVATLHAQVRTNVLVDGPRELVVQLPRDKGHQERSKSDDARNDDQKWLGLGPDNGANLVHVRQDGYGILNLSHLNGAVNQETEITRAQSDHLNGVFHTECVIHQDQLVDKPETVESEEGGDGPRRRTRIGLLLNLKVGENVTRRDRQISIGFRFGPQGAHSKASTYHSRPSVTNVWTRVTMAKDQVH
jgi:hypothetical protein